MILGTINRMILMELIKIFLISLTGLTGMFLVGGLIQEANQKGLSPMQILMAIPLIVPNTFPYTIPATTLFASCVVYGRMSADSEVLVLRAAGVNIYKLLWPAIILGFVMSVVTAALYHTPIPRSQQLLRESLLKDAEEVIYGLLKREGALKHGNLDYVLYVREVQGKDLIDVIVKKRKADKSGGYDLIARASTATIKVEYVTKEGADNLNSGATDEATTQGQLAPGAENGQHMLVVYMDKCNIDKGDGIAEFINQRYAIPLPEVIFGKDNKDRPIAQTWDELFVRRQEAVEDRDKGLARMNELANSPTALSPAEKDELSGWNLWREKHVRKMVRQYDVEIASRPALALGCLAFALIGCPVGVWASRSDYLSIFMICFLPTVFVYYPLLLASMNMAKGGTVPVPAVGFADAFTLLMGVILVRRLMKR